jgi:hypothetical protein
VISSSEDLDGGQVVQFYRHEEELAHQVAGYLLSVLQGAGVAVVIATAAHRRAFEGRLTRAGVDLAAAARDGRYRALDAADTVGTLMTGQGQVDRGAFDRVTGGLITDAGQGGRPVRAYGEMVALLWDAGLVNAAVQVEQMWASLGLAHPFSLLCSYPISSVAGDGHLEAFAEVRRRHGSVVGDGPLPPRTKAPGRAASGRTAARDAASRAFGLSGDAPAAARHFAVDAVRRLGAAGLADDTALVVTELAANAVVHAQTGFTVTVTAAPDVLRISVRDLSPPPAAGLPPRPLHGLGAVDALASRWGVEPLGRSGKLVWAELRR